MVYMIGDDEEYDDDDDYEDGDVEEEDAGISN